MYTHSSPLYLHTRILTHPQTNPYTRLYTSTLSMAVQAQHHPTSSLLFTRVFELSAHTQQR
uniref:Uncharacterized protein n=1 Tax=Octopus bimaculoides TaxID=37653 RepID=A0A0L8HR68_OCTBM